MVEGYNKNISRKDSVTSADIKHYQNLLLGMIKQQRYWQGRSLAEEVNKRWWKDTNKI